LYGVITMASIYKRDKIWWVHYLVAGKSVCKSLKTANERVALDKKQKLEALEITGQLMQPSNTPVVTFLQSFCEYLAKTRTKKSAKNDFSYLRGFFGPCCPALHLGSNVPKKFRRENQDFPMIKDKLKKRHIPVRNLEDISSAMVSNFIQDRIVSDNIKAKTANRMREVLHKMFSHAIEHNDYICPDRRYRNPIEGVKRLKEDSNPITWLEDDEIAKQLDALKEYPVIHALVAVYIYAGLRREEALWLTDGDVDLKERFIRVVAKNIDGEYWQPKTKKNRVVPISNALYEILSKYEPLIKSVWYFPSPTGKRWDPDNFSQTLQEINDKKQLQWSCLDFRHTFGSHLAQKGESLYKIAELMGNSPEICRKHYAALIPEKMRDTVEFAKKPLEQKSENVEEMLKQILLKLDGDNSKLASKIRLVK
jgi:integrase